MLKQPTAAVFSTCRHEDKTLAYKNKMFKL